MLMPAGAVRADCKLVEIAEFHVDPGSTRPIVDGEINGQPVKILFDLGSSVSLIPVGEARRLGLRMSRLEGVRMYGFGGDVAAYDANIKELKVGEFKVSNLALVAAGDQDAGSKVSLLLGDDFFSRADVEVDLRDNAVRLFQPQDCKPPQLVYWGHAYSQATILPWSRDAPATQITATINGKQILAEFDTGAGASIIDETAAEIAGVTRPGGQPADVGRGALSAHPTDFWTGHFDSLALGEEKLSNIRLQVARFAGGMAAPETGTLIRRQLESTPYLLIGADFFHAHRVFIDNKDHLILFSYEGGPVFRTPETAPHASH
ncbi:MAG TPA: aspartyl protease family protein [Caulobacteraceae bacterium]|nr:aspartyl protease family protein [Caulobacteraceae bacterium]